MATVNGNNLYRWWIPIAASASLLAILLFVFPFNSGDSSVTRPLGLVLWTLWTTTGTDIQDHTYCLLVPLMVGYVLYEKRKDLARMPVRGSSLAIVWILLGLAAFWIGSRAGKQYLGCLAIQLLLFGLISWFWGGAAFRQLLFAWTIIVFAWPLTFLDTTVAFKLRLIVSTVAFHVLNLVGIPSLQSGTALLSAPVAGLPVGGRFQIDVADPCSGLHSLLPLLMFSSFYCYFFLPKRWQKWTVFLSAFVFTIAGNVARIVLLVLGCIFWGSAFAIGTNDHPSSYHEACGFAVFVIVLGLECLFGALLVAIDRRRSGARLEAGPGGTASGAVAGPGAVPAWRSAAVFGLVAAMFIAFLATPPVYLPSEAGVLMSLPGQVRLPSLEGGHFYGTQAEVSDAELRMLPKDTEFARMNYDDFHEHSVFFSIVLSGLQQYTIHPPEVCLKAQGWEITDWKDIPVVLESGHRLVVRNLSLQRQVLDSGQKPRTVKAYYMYWYVADDLTTPSHFERNLISSWDRVLHNRDHRWAYVIAMAPITDTLRPDGMNAEQTRDMLLNFIRKIVPTFQKNELQSAHTADNS